MMLFATLILPLVQDASCPVCAGECVLEEGMPAAKRVNPWLPTTA